jgi:BlaI family transcriptional regulator, penicillinase repressor
MRKSAVARPKHENPTPAELEILQLLWNEGPQTVRQVMERLNRNRPRAYTSVMSLLNVMTEKGMLARQPERRAFVYSAALEREQTLGEMVADLLGRAFGGSATALVTQLLAQANPDEHELSEIRRTIREYQQER